jgi:hypothetical protein
VRRITMISVEDGFPEFHQLDPLRVREGKGVASLQPWRLCHRGGLATTWVDSDGESVLFRCF